MITNQKYAHFSDIWRETELSWRLLLGDKFFRGFIERNLFSFCNDIDLFFDQRSHDPSWADSINSDAFLGIFKSQSFRESYNSVFGSNVGALIDWSNESVNWGNIDDSSPSSFLHVRKRVFAEIEGSTKIERNDLFPFGFREVDTFVNVLHTSVVDQNVDSSEFFESLIHDLFAVCGLGQIGKNVEGFSVGVLGLKLFGGFLDFFFRGKAIENDVESFGSQGVSNSKTNSAQGASDEGNFVVAPESYFFYLATRVLSRFANRSISK